MLAVMNKASPLPLGEEWLPQAAALYAAG